jgi:aryl-alcohol dehydrogenase-like predicted oxidoreductase
VSDLGEKVTFGRSGLSVSRLGVGSSFGVSERACKLAFDAGVNYFFWGSVRTPSMGAAIRDLSKTHRDELVVVLECYARWPWMIRKSVEQGLRQLGVDHVDVLLLGWHESLPSDGTLDAVDRLKEQGRFRSLGISSHQRPLFQEFVRDERYDVCHIRYNAAHPGAEQDIFPHLDDSPPGIASFTNTRWGDLLKAENMPEGLSPPSAPDCYRFALSNPNVQVALCGPSSDREMQESLDVLKQGPLDQDEMLRMRKIGEHVHGIRSVMAVMAG